MNDEIAGGKRARLGENVLGAAPALRLPYETIAENVLLANDGEVRRFEPLFERDDSERQRASARCRRLMIGRYELEWFEAMLGQNVTQPLARTVAPAGDDHVQAPLAHVRALRARGVEHFGALVLRWGKKLAPGPPAAIDDVAGARLRLEWREPRHRLAGKPLLPLAFAEIKPRRRQRLIVRLTRIFRVSRASRCIIIGDERNTLVGRVVGATVEHERRTTDIVEDRVELIVEQRQPMFDADGAAAFTDGGVEIVVWSGRAELRCVALAETFDRIGRQARFAHRHEIKRAQLRGRALRLRIEGADRFERIAEEIKPDRRCRARRIEVEDAAARGVIADVAHGARARIAVRLEPVREVFHPHAVARRGGECG